jgi:dihydrofolate synthase/folylpolyglutamate synthase
MTARTLADWLDYQQRIHPRAIELGLDRVREVWQRLGAPRPAPLVVTVGGTNGKGSTVAFLEAMLRAAGRRVGAYTSPHLRRYNERVRVCGAEVGDAALIDAFTRIEAARGAVPLTYFEFGTLAALWIFAQSGLDAAVLEVGLGGRLDAVNLIDADAAIVTTVDLDHQDWLGNDRDSIGREKAGIFRPGRPAVIGTRTPPAGLIAEAERIGARLLRAGRDFHITPMVDAWCWRCGAEALTLPEPMLAAPCQIDNVAAAIAAWHALRERLGWEPRAFADGVRAARLPARLQRFVKPDAAELVIDVGHNPQAAAVLADWLQGQSPRGRTYAVFGALADKDVGGIVAPLAAHVARWYGGGLDAETPRGLPAPELRTRMLAAAPLAVESHEHIRAALAAAAAAAGSADRILAFGSFFVASAALDWAEARAYRESPERAGYN